jgi:hypothetical protein
MKLKLIVSQEWQLSPLFREQLAKWQRQKATAAKPPSSPKAPRLLPSAETLERRHRHKEALRRRKRELPYENGAQKRGVSPETYKARKAP